MRLAERVVIVTGGGLGIGRAFSHALAREGARVVIADIDLDAAEQTAEGIAGEGGVAVAIRTDVSEPAQAAAMASAAIERFGRIDGLVNNAALFTALPLRDLEEIDVAEWDRVMAVNLRGPFLCARAVLPEMKRRGSGKIVNVSSASILKGNARRVHYVTSKAGLIGLTRSLARACGPYNICVNSLLPGSTASETAMAAYAPEHFAKGAAQRALGRIEQPADLIGPLIFLCSSESDFVTGQSIVVDGGSVMY